MVCKLSVYFWYYRLTFYDILVGNINANITLFTNGIDTIKAYVDIVH